MHKTNTLRWISLGVLLIAAALLAVSVIGADDTASDPLVSLGYLNGTFRSGILSQVDEKIRQESGALSDKLNTQIAAVRNANAQHANVQPTHTTITVGASTSYTAPTGSEFLVLSGSLRCTTPTLTDTTTGERVQANAALTVDHLYIATASSVLQASETSQILVRKP